MMRKFIFLTLFVITFPGLLKADVIYAPNTASGSAFSFELIGSYELAFSKFHTINFWGGFGAVSMINNISHPAYGTEMAVELRQYFKSNSFKNFNIGLYAGLANMRHSEYYNDQISGHSSIGFVPGIKLTYKKRFNSWLVGEPYVGASAPWYDSHFKGLLNGISHNSPSFVITFGIRIGFNKVS